MITLITHHRHRRHCDQHWEKTKPSRLLGDWERFWPCLSCLVISLLSPLSLPTRSTNPDPRPGPARKLAGSPTLRGLWSVAAGCGSCWVCCERNGQTFINGFWRFHGTVGWLFNALTANYRIFNDKAPAPWTTIARVISWYQQSSQTVWWRIKTKFFSQRNK